MKLSTHVERELELVELQVRFFKMINGLLAGAILVGLALAVYKIVSVVI